MATILITGANRGIGLALTKNYLQLGWQVHTTFRDSNNAHELLALMEENQSLHCHQLDVTDYQHLNVLAERLPPIDVLVNNAGYYGPKGTEFGNTDVEEWRKVFEINSIAPLKLVEALYPRLQQAEHKKIICISSKVGSMTENTSGGGYIYRSSKAALNSVVKSLSNDLSSKGIITVALHPGWVRTEMGGPNASISTEQSTQGMITVIDSLQADNSGEFINYDGTRLPW
ncbi:SDR family oxidoreductase [Vibrio sp. MA40-2]|uniref:SDR family oxidoreductase n=1 Tax=Vibrio sp. MA40-2 TaxID=3391828 RepID=UPI0039A5C734